MPVTIRKLQFQSERLPTQVRVLLADADEKEDATVWISAQFELGERSTDKLQLLALEALDQLQSLIAQGRENVAREPGAPTQ